MSKIPKFSYVLRNAYASSLILLVHASLLSMLDPPFLVSEVNSFTVSQATSTHSIDLNLTIVRFIVTASISSTKVCSFEIYQ